MMLKTSSRKLNPFKNMLGFTLYKCAGFTVMLCIAALLYCPGSFAVNFDDLKAAELNGFNSMPPIDAFAVFVTVFASASVVLLNVINFAFLYKKNSSDVFHAFPLTRCELILSRFSAGLISTLLPTLLCYASFGVMAAFNSWLGSLTSLAFYLLHTIIIILVCSSFSMIFIICAGSMFDLWISMVGINISLLFIGLIFDSILQETLLGYNGSSMSDILYNLSPPYFCGVGLANAIGKAFGDNIAEFLIRSVIYIIAFTAIALVLYNRRRAEKSEQAYAYKFMYLICGILAGICGGYIIGILFNSNISSPTFFIFMIVGSILTTVIYGVVTNRGFKRVSKSIALGCASAAIISAVSIFGVTGGLGYSNKIPKSESINEACITIFDEAVNYDKADIDDIIALHRKITETDAASKRDIYNKIDISFKYKLKNSKTLTRSFWVDPTLVEDELLSVYKNERRINKIKNSDEFKSSAEISLEFPYGEGRVYTQLTHDEAVEFLNAYTLDIQSCDSSIFENANENLCVIRTQMYNNSYSSYQLLADFKTFANTNRFIEEHNVIERSE